MTTGFFGGRDLKSHFFQTKSATFVGVAQTQSNSLNLPAPAQVNDMAIFYGVVVTSATASGTQAVAAGPSGWTILGSAQGGPVQVSTAPQFLSRGVWWKKLTAADIAVANGGTGTGVVSFTLGTLATLSACGVMVFRGGTTVAPLSFNTFDNSIHDFTTSPAKTTTPKLYVMALCLRPDLNEVITPPSGWVNIFPGAMVAGAFFFYDPSTYPGSVTTSPGPSWTTSSGGALNFIVIR